jgi:hypothetical protein
MSTAKSTDRAPLPETELLATAHHEAGHAVACVRFGIAFDHIALTPDGEKEGGFVVGGYVRRRLPSQMRVYVSRRTLANEVFMLMAGDAAVRPFFTANEEHFAMGRKGDVDCAMRLLELRGYYDAEDVFRHVPPAERAAFIEEQRQRAIKWARDPSIRSGGYWGIRAVADALFYRGTLSSVEVAAIVENAILCDRPSQPHATGVLRNAA